MDSAGSGVEKTFMVSVMPSEGGVYPKILDSMFIPTVVFASGAIATVVILIRRIRRRSQLNEAASSSLSDSPVQPPEMP